LFEVDNYSLLLFRVQAGRFGHQRASLVMASRYSCRRAIS
jgi:hypothetical protein